MTIRALSLFIILLYSPPAFSSEGLRFKTPSNYKEKLVTKFISKQEDQVNASYLIAKVDLNNDMIDEYIVKAGPCKTGVLCSHYIVALPKYTALLIGNFASHKINISYKNSYGVRNLWIYGNKNNNFTYSTAQWNPFSFKYELNQK